MAQEISGIPASWPGSNLEQGSRGEKVRQMQEEINVIAGAYPAIPKIDPDGIYGPATAAAVEKIQSVFGLPVTGVVDYRTWYKISEIYVGVIQELTVWTQRGESWLEEGENGKRGYFRKLRG